MKKYGITMYIKYMFQLFTKQGSAGNKDVD